MGRKGGRKHCPRDHKTIFKSRRIAMRTARQLPDTDNRIYWCQEGGGYHLTRYEVAEYHRRQAEGHDEEGEPVQPQLAEIAAEIVTTQQDIGRGGDCPTCGWLHGFHDPVLHSYHDVPKRLTWKVGQPAPWQEPVPARRSNKPVVNIEGEAAEGLERLLGAPPRPTNLTGLVIQSDEVDQTLSVLKGLTADDLF